MKSKGIMVRFTEQEHAEILEKAATFETSVSEFLNRLGLEKPVPEPEKTKNLLEIIYHLNRVGNNLNQISLHLNAGRNFGSAANITEKEILTAALEVKNLHRKLKNELLKWQF